MWFSVSVGAALAAIIAAKAAPTVKTINLKYLANISVLAPSHQALVIYHLHSRLSVRLSCKVFPDKTFKFRQNWHKHKPAIAPKVKPTLLVIPFLLIVLAAPGFAGDAQPDVLTPAERVWLARHPDIVLGVGEEWVPWVVKRGDGQSTGFAADHLALLGRKLGIRLGLEAGPWRKIVAKAESLQLAGLTLSAPLPERQAHFLFTGVFHTVHAFIYLRTGERIDSSDLAAFGGKRVGYLKGVLRLEKQLAAYPGIVAAPLEGLEALAQGLLEGSLDAVLSSYDLEYWRASHGVLGFSPTRIVRDTPPQMVISVRKDWPELVGILNKGLAAITPEEMAELYRRWFGSDYLRRVEAAQVPLTAGEQAWLAAHPVLRAGIDSGWAPVEFADEKGIPQGISVAYLKRLETLLGVHFELVTTANWEQSLQGLETGTVDILPAATATPDRLSRMHFTKPFLSFPAAIFSAADVAYLGGIQALEGKPVAVIRDEAPQEWLQADWPKVDLLDVANTQEAVRMMAKGDVFAFIGNLATTSYYIGQSGLTQVKVSGETPYSFQLGMAVRHDWPILASILQKGLEAIPKQEQNAIYNEWISIRYKQSVDYTRLWQVSAAALLILAVILYWNRKLAGEVMRRRRVEAALNEAKESADRANRAKSDFLASVSHELRTPLNAMLGFAQLLESGERLGKDKQLELVYGVRRGGERLLELINDLLDTAKIEAERFQLEPKEWETGNLPRELDSLFRARAEAKGILLTIEVSDALPERLWLDAKRLLQILVNMLDNAIKYTHEGSIKLSAGYEDGHLSLEVADTGIGMPADEMEHIFEPFKRLGAGEQRPQGTGLGLTITRRLVEHMGGTITVDSIPGQGSRFLVRIPAKSVASASTLERRARPRVQLAGYRRAKGDGPLRILIIDDERDNREVLRGMLQPLGFSVREAGNGRLGLKIAEDWVPDLIFMDIFMPDMDGLETTQALRKHPCLCIIPVVAVSAAAFAGNRTASLAAGCDAFLTKPVFKESLAATLEALLPLEWLHGVKDPDVALPPEFATLSREQAESLARLIGLGNITALKEFAGSLNRDGCCPVLAKRIGALAEDFDMAGLERLCGELRIASLQPLGHSSALPNETETTAE